jgi:hypothetical protein
MAKPSELVIPLLLLTALAPGCSGPEADDLDVVIAPGDGKYDSLAGKSVRVRRITEQTPALQTNRYPALDKVATMTVNVATDDQAVMSGTAWIFEDMINWRSDSILKLSAVPSAGSKASEVMFMLIDLSDGQPLSCRGTGSASAQVNLFKNVAIDLEFYAIHADNKTYSFDACGLGGIDSGSAGSNRTGSATGGVGVALFAVPWTTTGSLEGSFNYYVKASLE